MRKHEYRKKRYGGSRSAEYHRRDCDFCGTPVTQEEKQKKKQKLTEKLPGGRVPRCGIACAVRVSRGRVISHIKKRNPGCRIGSCEDGRTSDY